MKATMVKRRPNPIYDLEYEGKKAKLYKTGQDTRSKRWELAAEDGNFFFTSKRSAIHFFKTGEIFKTKPVYLSRGKQQRRIR